MRLALDTATDRASVALDVGGLVRSAEVLGARRHAAALLPLVERLLREARTSLVSLDTVLLADGPGSFTGLRVGAAVAKALVATRGAALLTAPSLLVRATRGATLAPPGAVVVGAADALRGEVYAAAYRLWPDRVEVVEPPKVWRPAALRSAIDPPAVLVAELPAEVRAAFDGWADATLDGDGAAPRAADLLALAGRAGALRRVDDVITWEPEYGRPAEAQARWEQAHGRALPDPAGRPA
jgi:tRNA threonylcarbamoyladenosine biosynthesis protein TsaB